MNSLSKLALVLTFCTGMIACSGGKAVKGDYGVVPLPQEVTLTNGNPFVLSPSTKIFYPEGNDKMKKNAEFLASYIKEITGYELATATGQPGKGISLVIDQSIQNPEGYQLTVSDNGIRIAGSTDAGVFYGIQTLRKSIPATAQGMNVELPAATINDYPRFAYRGMMLDVSRHFFPVDSVKTYLDILALHNQNTFHWHLSDDQGWRIEIKKYPELTQIGSKRKETVIGHNSGTYDGKEYGGFYTQDQIRDVINYAAERHITIIPEIDMPGHAEAALVAYPELGCFGDTIQVPENGFTQNIFCAGKTHTLDFLKNVLDEVCELFPSEYIHLGGDEAPKGNWDTCPDCGQCIKEHGLKDSHDLQLWFSAQMANYLKNKGRKAIFWGDVVYQDGYALPDNVVIHWWNWRGHKDTAFKEALKRNLPVICGTNYYTYLNFPVTPWKGYEAARTFDIKDVYTDNPSYRKEDSPLLLGMSCALWTDYRVTENMIDRRLFPRILAIAEQMWSRSEPESFELFYQKVKDKKEWFEKQGYMFGPGLKSEVTDDFSWD